MKNSKMTEELLASNVISWLEEQHWDIYQEVQFHQNASIADIVAVRNGQLWVIECKQSLTLTVLEQAYRWKTHLRSVAVPRTKTRRQQKRVLAYKIAKDYLRVGVLEVSQFGEVFLKVPAPIMREYHNQSVYYKSLLKDEHKHYAKAGTRNGGYYTPYQDTIKRVKDFISNNPGCTLKEIMDFIGRSHYSNKQSARQSLRTALEHWESEWCCIKVIERKNYYFIKK